MPEEFPETAERHASPLQNPHFSRACNSLNGRGNMHLRRRLHSTSSASFLRVHVLTFVHGTVNRGFRLPPQELGLRG